MEGAEDPFWFAQTASDVDVYCPLQWLLPTSASYTVVAPVHVSPGILAVALPAEVAPWLVVHICGFGAAMTGLYFASEAQETCTVVILKLALEAAGPREEWDGLHY